MARCLVTGGAGFVGSHIVARLLQDGHQVDYIDNLSSPCEPWPWWSGAGTWAMDIMYQDWFTWNIVQKKEYSVVFHTAAIARTVPCISDPLRCHEVNATGSLKVFDTFRETRIVHSSSNVVYGSPTPYRASKLAAEMYAESYNALYGGNIICLRYSNVIGPRLRKGDPAVLSALRDCREANGYVEITGDGTQTRNFTFVEDIVEANMLAAFGSDYKGVLDITTGVQTSMNEFASHFSCPIRYIEERKGDTKHIHRSDFEARRILGWEPKVELAEAIRRSL